MNRIDKPWGHEILVAHNEHYALKDIWIKAGTRTSLQSHTRKTETVLILSGKLSLEHQVQGAPLEVIIYGAGETYDIEPGVKHRATALQDTRLIEVSTPDLDDLIRYEDDFGRHKVQRS